MSFIRPMQRLIPMFSTLEIYIISKARFSAKIPRPTQSIIPKRVRSVVDQPCLKSTKLIDGRKVQFQEASFFDTFLVGCTIYAFIFGGYSLWEGFLGPQYDRIKPIDDKIKNYAANVLFDSNYASLNVEEKKSLAVYAPIFKSHRTLEENAIPYLELVLNLKGGAKEEILSYFKSRAEPNTKAYENVLKLYFQAYWNAQATVQDVSAFLRPLPIEANNSSEINIELTRQKRFNFFKPVFENYLEERNSKKPATS